MSVLVMHLDWGTLNSFAQVRPAYRKLVVSELNTGIKFVLSHFIPYKHQSSFWNLMKQTNRAVFGSIVRTIMMAGDCVFYRSFLPQMDMIIPQNSMEEDVRGVWESFLQSIGYVCNAWITEREPYEHCTRTIRCYTQTVKLLALFPYGD
jgi:hypothetical protein